MEDTVISKEEAELEEEGCTLYTNGKVRLWWHEEPSEEKLAEDPDTPDVLVEYVLRLPRFREYKRFRDGILEMQSSANQEDQERQIQEWTKDVVKTLSKRRRQLPEDPGDWPMWMSTGFLQGALVQHWSDVPLVLGVKTTTPKTEQVQAAMEAATGTTGASPLKLV